MEVIVPDGCCIDNSVPATQVACGVIDLVGLQFLKQGCGSGGICQIELMMVWQQLGCTTVGAMHVVLRITGEMME